MQYAWLSKLFYRVVCVCVCVCVCVDGWVYERLKSNYYTFSAELFE